MAAPAKGINNSYKMFRDTIIPLDSIRDKKLLKINQSNDKKGIKSVKSKGDTTKKSSQALDAELTFSDDDSTVTDNVHKILYLYGHARVKYQDVEMDADYIRVDQKNHLIFAKGVPTPLHTGILAGPLLNRARINP